MSNAILNRSACALLRRGTPPGNHGAGYTLLEVLVALVVLSIGLLGLGMLQATSLQDNTKAYLRSIAVVRAYDMADRMRTNMDAVRAGDYDSAPGSAPAQTCLLDAAGCTPAQIAAIDQWAWSQELASDLPGGNGVITNLGLTPAVFQIDVRWQESGSEGEAGQGCDPTDTSPGDTGFTCFRYEFRP